MIRVLRASGLWLALLLGLVVFPGCPADVEPDPFQTALLEGWQALSSRRLDEAEGHFREALALRRGEWEPLTGLGWVRLHGARAGEAMEFFDTASTADPSQIDPSAGRVLAYALLERRAEARTEGLGVLARDPGYVLFGDPSYAASDVRWIVSRAALDLGEYAIVAAQLDALSPGHGLDPGAASFPERALALLETLRATV